MGAIALHGYSSMELKSRSFTSKEPHVAREPQVADPWSRGLYYFIWKERELFCGSREENFSATIIRFKELLLSTVFTS
jgi:hypothetical protein